MIFLNYLVNIYYMQVAERKQEKRAWGKRLPSVGRYLAKEATGCTLFIAAQGATWLSPYGCAEKNNSFWLRRRQALASRTAVTQPQVPHWNKSHAARPSGFFFFFQEKWAVRILCRLSCFFNLVNQLKLFESPVSISRAELCTATFYLWPRHESSQKG